MNIIAHINPIILSKFQLRQFALDYVQKYIFLKGLYAVRIF